MKNHLIFIPKYFLRYNSLTNLNFSFHGNIIGKNKLLYVLIHQKQREQHKDRNVNVTKYVCAMEVLEFQFTKCLHSNEE